MRWKGMAVGVFATFILCYPMLFYVHKYAVPWTGMDDFTSYHQMVLRPFTFDDIPAPFSMRRLTPLIAHLVMEMGLIYPNEIWFEHFLIHQGRSYSKDVFWALLFTNFLGVALAGGVVYSAAARFDSIPDYATDRPSERVLSGYGLLALSLFLLAGNTIFYVIAPLVDGWTCLFAVLIVILARRTDRFSYLALPLILLSVFQRELLIVMAGAFAFAELALPRVFGLRLCPHRLRFLIAIW